MTDLSGYEARNAEREKIKAAATKGPWRSTWDIPRTRECTDDDDNVIETESCELVVGMVYYDRWWPACSKPDAAFIAAARNDEVERDVRELIAMVKERDARIAELERDAKRWKWCEENAVDDSAGWELGIIADYPGQSFAAAVDAAISSQSHNS